MKTEQEPQHVFIDQFELDGKPLRIEIKSYPEPVKTTKFSGAIQIYATLEILDGMTTWGHMNFDHKISTQSSADLIIKAVKDHPEQFKNQE